MTHLESIKTVIQKNGEEVFNFLSDFNNIGKLMPEQVEKFVVENDTCSFTIKGMATLGLSYESKVPHTDVVMNSHGKVPFDFKLRCKIEVLNQQQCNLQLFLDADLNPFLKMMAEKPLTNFLNLLVSKYAAISANA